MSEFTDPTLALVGDWAQCTDTWPDGTVGVLSGLVTDTSGVPIMIGSFGRSTCDLNLSDGGTRTWLFRRTYADPPLHPGCLVQAADGTGDAWGYMPGFPKDTCPFLVLGSARWLERIDLPTELRLVYVGAAGEIRPVET